MYMIEKCCINVVVALIEIICLNEICKKIKKENFYKVWICIITIIAYACFSILTTLYTKSKYLNLLFSLIILLFYTFSYKILFTKRLIAICCYIVFSMALEILTLLTMGTLLNVSVDILSENLEYYLFAAVISKFILYLLIKIVLTFAKPSNFGADFKYGVLNLILPIATLGILIILSNIVFTSNEFGVKIRILIVSILLIFANFGTFIIFEYSVKNKVEKERQRAELIILNERQNEYINMIEQQLRSNKEIHDFKHKMYKIRQELSLYDGAAVKIINELCEVFEQKELVEFTGKKDIDALLNVKMKKALDNNMKIKYRILITNEIWIDSMDLCVLLGNILDNALEHSAKNADSTIELRMHTTNNLLAISSHNSVVESKIIAGKSSKKDEYRFHGYGLLRIEELTKKYQGNVNYRIINNRYEINMILNNCISHPESS